MMLLSGCWHESEREGGCGAPFFLFFIQNFAQCDKPIFENTAASFIVKGVEQMLHPIIYAQIHIVNICKYLIIPHPIPRLPK